MRILATIASAAIFTTILTASTVEGAALPVQPAVVMTEGIIHPAGLSERKAATKAWFKRKGHQTANWFQRQKRKLENLVD